MGSKPAKLKERDVPAHNPLINNENIRMHFFKDREKADETEIRQENHFILVNKKGVVDDGKTLVGLRKDDHKGKIYYIKRLPNKYSGNQPQPVVRVSQSASRSEISYNDQMSRSENA